jgi:hypothetical protein
VEYSSKLQRIVEDFKSAIFSIVAAVSSSQTLKGQKTPKDTVQIFQFKKSIRLFSPINSGDFSGCLKT